MWYALFNDLIASVQGDSSTSANIISGLFSRPSNVILEKSKRVRNETGCSTAKPKTKYMTSEEDTANSRAKKSSSSCYGLKSGIRTGLTWIRAEANLKMLKRSKNRRKQ